MTFDLNNQLISVSFSSHEDNMFLVLTGIVEKVNYVKVVPADIPHIKGFSKVVMHVCPDFYAKRGADFSLSIEGYLDNSAKSGFFQLLENAGFSEEELANVQSKDSWFIQK